MRSPGREDNVAAILVRLAELLRSASVDGFAGVMEDGLGAGLRGAADALLGQAVVESPWREQLEHFRGGLERFEERGRHDRSRVVAHGLRIAAGLRSFQVPAGPARRAPPRDLGPTRARPGRGAGGASVGAAEAAKAARVVTGGAAKAGAASAADVGVSAGASAIPASDAKAVSSSATATTTASASAVSSAKAKAAKASAGEAAKASTTRTVSRAKAAPQPEPPRSEPTPDMSRAPLVDAGEALTTIPGIGLKTAEKLALRGVETVEDLAFLLPKTYEDRRERRRLADVQDGESAVIEVVVTSFREGFFRGRYLATLEAEEPSTSAAEPSEEPAAGPASAPPLRIKARWFHRVGGLGQRLARGATVSLIGAMKIFRGERSMVHPEVREADAPGPAIAVRYPEVEGVGHQSLARYCRAAVARLREPRSGYVDALPRALAERYGLPAQLDALALLHDPPASIAPAELRALASGTSPAHRRLAFDEFFFLQLALLHRRSTLQRVPCALGLVPEAIGERERLRAAVPFEPTRAQWRAIAEIEADMAAGRPMLRLLQGDVGAGKTLVAFAACLAVISAGGQAAIMAPTEILAEQHLRTLSPWCRAAGVRLGLLTGSTPKAQRTSLLALLAGGEIDLVIGTHALIVDDVEFRQLGLAVVDEQHRFGVEQRAILRDKGAAPHLLVMTATPIPRSLALTAYGELDVSILDEMPPGRLPPETTLHAGKTSLPKARAALAALVRKGMQAYVVCPLVEASEVLDVSDVEATAAAIRELLPGVDVGVIHGRMAGRDKEVVMARFRSGNLRVLVATTVIEVGVDVREARAILIEHAERFGLAQLHQLRGRVGRGTEASWCILHTASPPSSDAGERLRVMVESCDGFRIAERDLELRGPGEVFGVRQSGVPRLRYYGFAGEGSRLLVAAREGAAEVLAADPGLARSPELRRELDRRLARQAVYSADAG